MPQRKQENERKERKVVSTYYKLHQKTDVKFYFNFDMFANFMLLFSQLCYLGNLFLGEIQRLLTRKSMAKIIRVILEWRSNSYDNAYLLFYVYWDSELGKMVCIKKCSSLTGTNKSLYFVISNTAKFWRVNKQKIF